MSPETVNVINIIGGVSAIAISIIAMALSITFYIAGRKTENSVSSSLAEIKTQTNALQKLSGKQIDKLMDHVFNGNISQSDTMGQIITALSQIPITITTILRQPIENPNQTSQEQIIGLYSALYFYIAQTNYWSQSFLPKVFDFDEKNEFHVLIKRVVDLSNNDFLSVATWLSQCDQSLIEKTPLYDYLKETKDKWRHAVRSSSDVFVVTSQE
ncbi:MAG: hypothetical protein WC600_05555 [Desulfobaccales bacterium]